MVKSLLLSVFVLAMAAGCSKGSSGPKGPEASLPELNRVLRVVAMTKGAYPTDVNELTNFPSLRGKRLPTPPAGKKLAIDPKVREVVFVDQ